MVIGIPRSGLIPAAHFATQLNVPLLTLNEVEKRIDLTNKYTIRKIFHLKFPKHILVVDDTSNTGLRINQALKVIHKQWQHTKVTSLAICSAKNSEFQPNLKFTTSKTPRLFAWNMFNHDLLTSEIAVDLDGVLCADPNQNENDDGENYNNFIKNAIIKVIPPLKVKAIITGRLEKYRLGTEEWLKRNSISFSTLIMNDAPSAKYRRENRFEVNGVEIDQISEFKSRMIDQIKPILFVESNLQQAINIHKLTTCNTYAFENDKYFGSTNFEF